MSYLANKIVVVYWIKSFKFVFETVRWNYHAKVRRQAVPRATNRLREHTITKYVRLRAIAPDFNSADLINSK